MGTHKITILGPGCANCAALEAAARQAVDAVGMDATIDKVTDPVAIAGHGVMSTPGLMVDGTVVSVGRVPTAAQIAGLLGVGS